MFDYLYFYKGVIYLPNNDEVVFSSKAENEKLWIDKGEGFEVFDIKGVNLGLGKPGYYATEHGVKKDEYLRWFKQIKDMGANVIRVYTLGHEAFYEAFYEFNKDNEDPLYMIHGVWVDDYLINSSYSALDKEFYKPFINDCKEIVDVIHGKHKSNSLDNMPKQTYKRDISQWVYGYILGIEWENTLVSYTDNSLDKLPQLKGEYLYTEDASNFEIFLAMIGEEVIQYETKKYGEQRTLAFSNWATTDPFSYPPNIGHYFKKNASIDVEHIKSTDKFLPGQFASYHIYPYYPDYKSFYENPPENTYLEYLTEINEHHTMPVVISEFGVPSSRGVAAYESNNANSNANNVNQNRNQGYMSEQEQGEALVSMYNDIKAAGSAGSIVFTWQDEWFKRTWNTMANIDLDATPYWSDYQTNEQYFGLMSFDPGKVNSICYVDSDKSDWTINDLVVNQGGYKLSMKYDEKFIYFLAEKDAFNLMSDKLYIPIDTTPKSGSKNASNLNISMSENADFVIEINGKENSRVWVQERYNTTNALYANLISNSNLPFEKSIQKDSPKFDQINNLIQEDVFYKYDEHSKESYEIPFHDFNVNDQTHYSVMKTCETGKLTYGNANPNASDFNSLADFCEGDGFVEIKIPWGLLNFSNPTKMNIHDDYYENYGVEYITINNMNVGLGDGADIINMAPYELKKLGKKPVYHERLKKSYYILQNLWRVN